MDVGRVFLVRAEESSPTSVRTGSPTVTVTSQEKTTPDASEEGATGKQSVALFCFTCLLSKSESVYN